MPPTSAPFPFHRVRVTQRIRSDMEPVPIKEKNVLAEAEDRVTHLVAERRGGWMERGRGGREE